MEHITQMLIENKILVVSIWLFLLFISERIIPASSRKGDWVRVARNAALWMVNVGLYVTVIIPLSRWATDSGLDWRPDWLSGLIELTIDVVILDLLIYWWHRANHVSQSLWRFHEIHHLDEFLDVSSSVRFHFGEVLLAACFRTLVVLVLDMPIASILVFETLVLVSSAFHHSNLRLGVKVEKAISYVLITPSTHWVHHHAKRSDTDSNYGTIFSCWDQIFGSKSSNFRTSNLKIGVEAKNDLPILKLLANPFTQRQ